MVTFASEQDSSHIGMKETCGGASRNPGTPCTSPRKAKPESPGGPLQAKRVGVMQPTGLRREFVMTSRVNVDQ